MSRLAAHLVLFVAVTLVSTSGPIIVLCHMDAFAVVFLRTGLAALLFFAWAGARGRLAVPPALRGRLVAGGVLLGAHFLLWVKAFDLTNFASNLLLMVAQPTFAALLGLWMGERPTLGTWSSLALALAGLSIIAGGDFALGPRALLGDGMCVLGGLFIAVYYAVGRVPRVALRLETFLAWTFLGAALVSLPALALGGARLGGTPARSWAWMAALVVLTTAGGGYLMNLAARHVRLFAVNLIIVLEPAIGIGLGALAFGARVTGLQLVGAALLVAAVVVGLRPQRTAEGARLSE